jgi:Putative mono-oxygenase ydhR
MVVQIVHFQLAGISPQEYEAEAERIAPAFADLPGLIAKAWLADPGANTYGGVYLWADRAAAEAYADGELLAAARRNPAFANFRSSILDTLAAPTALTTRALAGLSAAELLP